MNHIPQNVYYEGKVVVSIGCKMPDGRDATIGYIPNADDFDFGIASRRETITITSGVMVINGERVLPGETVVVEKDEQICLTTTRPTTYLCVYG